MRCLGGKPTIEEWAVYLNADLHQDREYFWVVQAFSEVPAALDRVVQCGSGRAGASS